MAYATLQHLKDRLGSRTSATNPGLYEQMTDRLSAVTADDAIGQSLLDDAESVVNQKLAKRFSVPVDVSSDTVVANYLRRCAIIIATYHGWNEHPKLASKRETVQALYDEVMTQLNAIADGRQELPATTTPTSATATPTSATAVGHERIFTEDAVGGL